MCNIPLTHNSKHVHNVTVFCDSIFLSKSKSFTNNYVFIIIISSNLFLFSQFKLYLNHRPISLVYFLLVSAKHFYPDISRITGQFHIDTSRVFMSCFYNDFMESCLMRTAIGNLILYYETLADITLSLL